MPGTIHVTVLEFKGATSSSQPSAKSLKVSMGKRYYQSWDKGDFSFPVTKLKEDLVVTLLDAGENEIAHADIRTIQIIEKGHWDEVFSLEGAGGRGHVHMKLQFVLSEEERKRIRVMRESAVKKKHETNPSTDSESTTSNRDSVRSSARSEQKITDFQKRLVQIEVVSPRVEASQADESPDSYREPKRRIIGSAIPIKVKDAPSSPVKHEAESPQVQSKKIETRRPFTISDKNRSAERKLGDDPMKKSQNQAPVGKPSSSVRKMISAFENSQVQEPQNVPKVVIQPAEWSLRKFKNHVLTENLHENPTRVSRRADNVSSNLESSQAKKELDSGVTPSPSNGEVLNPGIRIHDERSREAGSKCLTTTNIEAASIQNPKSVEYYEDYCSSETSGMWIFPDNTGHLCITTAGERVTRIIRHLGAKPDQESKVPSEPEDLEKRNVMHAAESGTGSSPHHSSNRLAGQVKKIVAIVGFGILVLLTRQKEPRKKHREEKVNLFSIPDYIDRMRLTE